VKTSKLAPGNFMGKLQFTGYTSVNICGYISSRFNTFVTDEIMRRNVSLNCIFINLWILLAPPDNVKYTPSKEKAGFISCSQNLFPISR
jgi:hypothetical protein